MNHVYTLLAIVLLSFAAGATTANRYPDYLPNVRKLAVENNCGAYSADRGDFSWQYHEIPSEAIAITLPSIQSLDVPKQQKKPKVAK